MRYVIIDRPSYLKRLSLICQILFLLFSIRSCSQEKQKKSDIFTMGTGGSLGSYEATGRAISRIVNKNQGTHGFQLQGKNTAGSIYNIDSIMKGEIEFGLAQADHQYLAINGLADWKDNGSQKDLRAIFALYTESVPLVATSTSGIRTMEDLRGKRVDIGHPESGSCRSSADALISAGIDWKKDIRVYGEEPYERTRMYLHGELDAYFDTIGHPSTSALFAVNSVPRARLVPITNIDQLLSDYVYYSNSIIPVKLYPGILNNEDVNTFGVRATLLTSASISDDVVYAITKAIFEEFESLGEFSPVLNTFTKESMLRV